MTPATPPSGTRKEDWLTRGRQQRNGGMTDLVVVLLIALIAAILVGVGQLLDRRER